VCPNEKAEETAMDSRNRRHARFPLEAQIRVTSIDAERDPETGRTWFHESSELCTSLSVGGAFIRTLDPPAPGRRLLLQIHLPGGESVEAVGRVAWRKRVIGEPAAAPGDAGAGVEFVASSLDAQSALARYLARARDTDPS
jgi:hypothetical protein